MQQNQSKGRHYEINVQHLFTSNKRTLAYTNKPEKYWYNAKLKILFFYKNKTFPYTLFTNGKT